MDTKATDHTEEALAETPEDVAVLYSWANLDGARYYDFAPARREQRALARHRAAEDLRQLELRAQAEAERAAREAENMALEVEQRARTPHGFESSVERNRALRDGESAVRRATADRLEAARRAEGAAFAEAAARREEREMAEARASAQRQAERWAESDLRRRDLAGPQPADASSLLGSDPYQYALNDQSRSDFYTPAAHLQYTQQAFSPESSAAGEAPREARGFRPDRASGLRTAHPRLESFAPAGVGANPSPQVAPTPPPKDLFATTARSEPVRKEPTTALAPERTPGQSQGQSPGQSQPHDALRSAPSVLPYPEVPAWLYGGKLSADSDPALVPDTLQHSREKLASRWFALRGLFEQGEKLAPEPSPAPEHDARTPVLAVFSFAGGVGKTSLVATLGRALSSMGERVLLADTTSHGLLPYYFGATELRPGVVRTFSPPEGEVDAPIHLVSYNVDAQAEDQNTQQLLADDLTRDGSNTHRILVDLIAGGGAILHRLAHLNPTILVPLAPDMNSVISLHAIERFFAGESSPASPAVQPYYVLSQFDSALPLHLDVREVLRRRLGERLLPLAIRRDNAVAEALAEGMTVVDYAPESQVAEDYRQLAGWLHLVAAPIAQRGRKLRWSER